MLHSSLIPILAAASGEDAPLHLPSQGAAEAAHAGGGSIVRTLLALVVVAALIYAVAYVLRRMRGGAVPVKAARGRGALASEATLALAPNRSVHVVRAGREVLVLGVAEQSVTHLRSYSEEQALELGLIEAEDDELIVPRLPDLRLRHPATLPALGALGSFGGVLVTRLRDMTARS